MFWKQNSRRQGADRHWLSWAALAAAACLSAQPGIVRAQSTSSGEDLEADQQPGDEPAAAGAEPKPQADSSRPGARSPRSVVLTLPIRDGEFVLGQIDGSVDPNGKVRLPTGRLLEVLQAIVAPAPLADLRLRLGDRAEVELDELTVLGLPMEFDLAELALRASVPPAWRVLRSISVGPEFLPAGETLSPARLSAVANFRSAFDVVAVGPDQGLELPAVFMDGVVRYRGLALETEARLDPSTIRFVREGSRVVYDNEPHFFRAVVGDINPVQLGFGAGLQGLGVSVFRVYTALRPFQVLQASGERSFTLTRPATVEAVINGITAQRFRLDPGNYNLDNIPLAQGANDVTIRIDDGLAQSQVISFSQFFDRSSLRKGQNEFAAHISARSTISGTGLRYDLGNFSGGGFFRYGLTEQLTLGGYGQAEFGGIADGVLSGVQANIVTRWGVAGADAAVAKLDGQSLSTAVRADFRRSWQLAGRAQSVAVLGERRSTTFSQPGVLTNNRFRYQVGADFSSTLTERANLGLSVRYGPSTDPNLFSQRTARLFFSYQLSARASLTSQAFYDARQDGRNVGGSLALVYRLGERGAARAQVEGGQRNLVRAGYQTFGGEGVGAWSAFADAQRSNEATTFSGGYARTLNRADVSVSHIGNLISDGRTTQRTSFQAATAIVFADGAAALSRPVFDSFALLTPHKSLGNAHVQLNRSGESYQARSSFLGGAVDPNLATYAPSLGRYDVPDAPLGYDIGSGVFDVRPPYRSGYRLVIGSEYSITLVGRLLTAEGEPVSLLGGRAYEVAEPDRAPLLMFTNRSGKFGAAGLRPGRWRIVMPTEPESVYEVSIPEVAVGFFDVGDLRQVEE